MSDELYFVKYPHRAFNRGLSNNDIRLLLELVRIHLQYCGCDYSREIRASDRHLALIMGCSTKSIYYSKRRLRKENLVVWRRGEKGMSYYRIVTDIEAEEKLSTSRGGVKK